MSTPDSAWFWADAALEWLEALEDAGDPAAVVKTLDLASASPRSRPVPTALTEAAHMAAELIAAHRGAPALYLPRAAWRWLERHGDALDRGALSSAQRAVRRLIAEVDAGSVADADDGRADSRAALLNLERRLQAVDRGAGGEARATTPAPRMGGRIERPPPLVKAEQARLPFTWPEPTSELSEDPPSGTVRGTGRSGRGIRRGRRAKPVEGATQPRLLPDELSEVHQP